MKVMRYLAQVLLYVPLMAILGYFSADPAYTNVPVDQALVRLSFTHTAQRLGECRERSPEELAKLAPNMRAATVCPRERAAVTIELEMDGKVLYHTDLAPSGIQKDGAATIYRRFIAPAGSHRFVARLKDRAEGEFNYVREQSIDLKPGRALVIDFHAGEGGFIFRT